MASACGVGVRLPGRCNRALRQLPGIPESSPQRAIGAASIRVAVVGGRRGLTGGNMNAHETVLALGQRLGIPDFALGKEGCVAFDTREGRHVELHAGTDGATLHFVTSLGSPSGDGQTAE